MLQLKIKIEGIATDDLVLALEEILRHVRTGCTVGADANDNGAFHFDVEEKAKKERDLAW